MVGTIEKEEGFLLLKPRISANTDRIARSIAMCKGIKEVFLTSGEYGFIAITKARGIQVSEIKNLVMKKGKFEKISALVKHQTYKSYSNRGKV